MVPLWRLIQVKKVLYKLQHVKVCQRRHPGTFKYEDFLSTMHSVVDDMMSTSLRGRNLAYEPGILTQSPYGALFTLNLSFYTTGAAEHAEPPVSRTSNEFQERRTER